MKSDLKIPYTYIWHAKLSIVSRCIFPSPSRSAHQTKTAVTSLSYTVLYFGWQQLTSTTHCCTTHHSCTTCTHCCTTHHSCTTCTHHSCTTCTHCCTTHHSCTTCTHHSCTTCTHHSCTVRYKPYTLVSHLRRGLKQR